MKEYTDRLQELGFKSHDAARIYQFFIKYFSKTYLNAFLKLVEVNSNVGAV